MKTSIKFKHLSSISIEQIVILLNHPQIRALMPLATKADDVESATAWVKAKESYWREYRYGPYAIELDGLFAGWGGLQPENNEPDLALVLLPEFWGKGQQIFKALIRQISEGLKITTITIHFPIIRKNRNAIVKLGFKQEGLVMIDGEDFFRYRLNLSKTAS